jgi:hypothetical protein
VSSTPSSKINGGGSGSVGTLYSYFNKHGFNRQATNTPSRRSSSPSTSPPGASAQ